MNNGIVFFPLLLLSLRSLLSCSFRSPCHFPASLLLSFCFLLSPPPFSPDDQVHHINGEGEDAGVVYSEMQARENSGESRTHLELLREIYPGYCGYKSETGGIMKNLRESCSHQKVMDYHKAFYRLGSKWNAEGHMINICDRNLYRFKTAKSREVLIL